MNSSIFLIWNPQRVPDLLRAVLISVDDVALDEDEGLPWLAIGARRPLFNLRAPAYRQRQQLM